MMSKGTEKNGMSVEDALEDLNQDVANVENTLEIGNVEQSQEQDQDKDVVNQNEEQTNENQDNTDNTDNTSDDVNNENSQNENQENQDINQDDLKIVRDTAIEKSNVTRTIKWILKNKSKLKFNLIIQRGSAWSLEQKSLFIHSLVYGYPFPPAYAQDKGDGELWLLDGKQRLTTIIDFCENKFKLHKKTPKCFGVNIADKKFKELPEQFRDEIVDTYFTIHLLKGLTKEERDTMFVRLNKGTPVSKIAQTRASYSDLIEQLQEIAELEFFQDHCMITDKARGNFVDQEIILQTTMILDENHELKGIGSVQLQNYVSELKEKGELLNEEVYSKFIVANNYLSVAVNALSDVELKQICKKVNVPMIIITSLKAIERNVPQALFGDFLVDFLIRNYSKESDYGKSCQSGSAKKENVAIRIVEMDKGLDEFVSKHKSEDDNKVEMNTDDMSKQVG